MSARSVRTSRWEALESTVSGHAVSGGAPAAAGAGRCRRAASAPRAAVRPPRPPARPTGTEAHQVNHSETPSTKAGMCHVSITI